LKNLLLQDDFTECKLSTFAEVGKTLSILESKGERIMKEINKEIKKPKPFFNPNPLAYASEMKEHDQWLYSHLEPKPDGTWSKPPCNAAGYTCDGTDPNNLTSFEDAFATCKANLGKLSGLGFSILASSPIKAIDMDHVFDKENGWNQQAWEELKAINTRVEWSPSHTGLHLFFTCPIMLESRKKTQPDSTGREIYFEKHYLTVTGQVVEGFPETINEVDPELIIQLYDKWFPAKEKKVKETTLSAFYIPEAFVNDPDDPLKGLSPTKDQVIMYCRNAPAGFGAKFDRLFKSDISEYKSKSEADMALVGMIAFHTSDYFIIKDIVQESELWDEKWERNDYCQRTIMTALKNRWK
jgi:primase-polymerase (primpol)-like protein